MGSSPSVSTTSEQSPLCSGFFFCLRQKRSHPPAPLLLLFRKRARSARLLGCKRPRDGSLSLPPFCGCLRFKLTDYPQKRHRKVPFSFGAKAFGRAKCRPQRRGFCSARAWRRFALCVVFAKFVKGKLVSLPKLCPGNASFPHKLPLLLESCTVRHTGAYSGALPYSFFRPAGRLLCAVSVQPVPRFEFPAKTT